jgi:poly-gamma-glutamate capsule biosynthesis protein CapA/YwtB (metallophosphatase superfamily)
MKTRREFLSNATAFGALAALVRGPLLAQEGGMSVAAVGDCLITRRFDHDDADTLALLKAVRGADAAFANVEMTFPDPNMAPAPTGACGDLNNSAEGPLAEELRWAGFEIVSTANNHSLDYGEAGMFATADKLEHAGIAHAGTGRNLADATAPAFYDSRRGRVALIACASTIRPWSLAADGNNEIPGRAGLNPLRFRTTYRVPPGQLKSLQEISGALLPHAEPPLVPQPQGQGTTFLGNRFVAGEPAAVLTAADDADVARITAAVQRAARNAELVIVSIHAHESNGLREVPAAFLVEFAHRCIDAGAHVFVGHGPHVLRGIEIYKQRPIFYSLGNFMFQAESMRQIPHEIYERCGIAGNDPSDFFDRAMKGFSDAAYWESAVARVEFRGHQATRVSLLPITLQQDLPRARRGTPIIAQPAVAAKIVERLARLSQPFGTRLTFSNGAGVVQLG